MQLLAAVATLLCLWPCVSASASASTRTSTARARIYRSHQHSLRSTRARSQDGVSWAQLPACTEEMVEMVTKVTSYGLQLSGDMSKQIEIPADPVPEGGACQPL